MKSMRGLLGRAFEHELQVLETEDTARTARVVVATTTTAAAATPMILLHEQLVADRVPRHLLTMTLFETTRMVMAMEATILALEPEELRALRRTKLSSQLAFHGMPALGELPQEAVTQEVAYAMVWKAWKTS
ncbi:hypothetical protein Tco_0223793 [Tanacetum coccineum]